MKRKYIPFPGLLLSLLLLVCISANAAAAGNPPLIVDSAGILSAAELSALTAKAEDVSIRYSCDVTVVFVRGYSGSSIMSYTDNFFDFNGYGYGTTEDGVMLLVDVQGREYWISTSGFGIDAFTDAGQLYLKDLFVSCLSDGDWSGAADRFISGCERFLRQARNGAPYDVGNMPRNIFNPFALLGDIGLGLLIGGLPLTRAKREMENVQLKCDAGEYIRGMAPQLTHKNDVFLGSNITRVPIPRDTGDTHGGSGGGSSIHVSSSGHTHGGSGGHF